MDTTILNHIDPEINKHLPPDLLRELAKQQADGGKPKRRKFNNNPVTYSHGDVLLDFDSEAERDYFIQLDIRQTIGDISGLLLQPQFELIPKFKNYDGKPIREVTYTADFYYIEAGVPTVVDVKGHRTRDYIICAKLFQVLYPEYRFLEVKAKEV
jgi:hypothetical protein